VPTAPATTPAPPAAAPVPPAATTAPVAAAPALHVQDPQAATSPQPQNGSAPQVARTPEEAAALKSKVQELEEEVDYQQNMMGALLVKERNATTSLVEARRAAIEAADRGFPVPVRQMGLLDEKVLRRAARARRIDDVQASVLQDVLLRDPAFRPVRIVCQGETATQEGDLTHPKLAEVSAAHGKDVAEAVLRAFLELDEWNPSGRYVVRIPWHEAQQRELQPAEVTSLIMGAVKPARPQVSRSSRARR